MFCTLETLTTNGGNWYVGNEKNLCWDNSNIGVNAICGDGSRRRSSEATYF